MTRLAIVGLGTVSAAHLGALERIPQADVVVGVDPEPGRALTFRGRPRPVVPAVEAITEIGSLDAAIVCVPTARHLQVCRGLAGAGLGLALVEKPLVASRSELDDLDRALGGTAMSIWPLLHFAHADEVRWARDGMARWTAAHGPVIEAVQYFSDPYMDDLEARRRSLAGSWLDSGVNALSVLASLVALRGVRDAEHVFAEPAEGARVRLELDGGAVASIVTSWRARRSSKHTHLALADGARLIVDHTAGTGLLVRDGDLLEHAAPTEAGSITLARYLAVYRDWLANREEAPARLDQARALLRVVYDAQERLDAGRRHVRMDAEGA